MADLDPTGLLGGDDNAAPETQFPPDSKQQAAADANTTTPDLATIPARPAAPDTSAQANTTQQVAAAGAQAQYSADALRAGTDAAAPPPVATDAAATRQAMASAAAPPSAAANQPPSADAPPTAGCAAERGFRAAADRWCARRSGPCRRQSQCGRAAAPTGRVGRTAASSQPAGRDTGSQRRARACASAGCQRSDGQRSGCFRAGRAAAGRRTRRSCCPDDRRCGAWPWPIPSDAQLGFQAVLGPGPGAGRFQWVAPPTLAHYRQTAALAGSAGTSAAGGSGRGGARPRRDRHGRERQYGRGSRHARRHGGGDEWRHPAGRDHLFPR